MMNNEQMIESISTINDTVLEGLSDSDKLIILANIILTISVNYFPEDISKSKETIAGNGKMIAYELMKHVSNDGLNLAMKAHHIIDISTRIKDGRNI